MLDIYPEAIRKWISVLRYIVADSAHTKIVINKEVINMLKRHLLIIALTFLAPIFVHAEEEAAGPAFSYYTLDPEITTNIHTQGQKLGYLQVRIDLMVTDKKNIAEIEHHEPLIRDIIIELVGKQTEDQVKVLAGREELRKTLLEELNNMLVAETGEAIIADLLFTKYLYQ